MCQARCLGLPDTSQGRNHHPILQRTVKLCRRATSQVPLSPPIAGIWALSRFTPDIPYILLAGRSGTPHPVGHSWHPELTEAQPPAPRGRKLAYLNIYFMPGMVLGSSMFMVSFNPFYLPLRTFLSKQLESQRERNLPKPQLTMIRASFVGAYSVSSSEQSPKCVLPYKIPTTTLGKCNPRVTDEEM